MNKSKVRIVDYDPSHRSAFRSLNEAWIVKYFKLESMDLHYLNHPKENILDKGGHICIAVLHDKPIGVCALVKLESSPFDYELAKMGVAPEAQGNGVGYLLGQAIIAKAKERNAKTIYIESNTILQPAIHLYRKLGFLEIQSEPSPYERCNIQMVLTL